MDLIERDEARASLDGLLADAANGRGRVALVTGTVATGKSELLLMLAERAIDLGALAITATGSSAERDLPLGVLSQLVHDAPLTPGERERALDLVHEGTNAALAGSEPLAHMDAQIVHALCTVLLELSERHPLLIVVDDVQHADNASLVCLAYLCRRVRFARVAAVFGHADHGGYAETSFQTELTRQPHCRRVQLPLLSRDGVLELAARRLGPEPAERFAAPWYDLSGGNPLLVTALAEDHDDAGRAAGEPPEDVVVGDRYGHAVLSCLRRGGPRLLRVARGLAVLGGTDGLDELLGLGAADVARAEQALAVAGLLARDGFRHEAARSAVLAEMAPEERAGLFQRAAELAHGSGAPASVVAGHLLSAGRADGAWAVPVLETAARQALRDGLVEPAVAYLKLALHACTDERERVKITTALVRAEWRINPSASAGHFPELTDAMHRGILRGYPAVVLAKALLWHGRFDDAQEVLDHVADPGADLDQEAQAELGAARSWLRSAYPSLVAHLPRALGERGQAALSSVAANRRGRAAAMLEGVLTRGPGDDLIAVSERILRNSKLDEGSLDTVESALLALTYGGAADAAAPWCDLFMEEAITRRAPSRQARLAAVCAEVALRRGDLPAAERHARLALEIMPHTSWGVAVGAPLGTLVLAATAMGKLADVNDLLDVPVQDAMFQTRYGLHYLQARGRYSLVTDHPRAALSDFEWCGRLMDEWGLDVPGLIPWRIDAAEACLRMGGHDRARRLVEGQLARCGTNAPRVQGVAMRLMAAMSEPRHRPMLLRRSSDLLQSAGGDRYELARTLFDLTDAYHALGEYRRAGMITRRATAFARECEAQPLLRALSRGGVGGEAQAADTEPAAMLSDAERRVAALAAAGYTNREIAGKLYVTVSTVEQHLTHTYRKLNITNRADLPTSAELGSSTAILEL
ncbi:AAA family ATPase [Nonomuraea phyllanthi]|uniref:helix-turn-helix transcriptional regulator n=1 Tax=Nonomuraea phyllanthi TaxID=2219224 RepID=UPI0012935557|nr:LuxR family transcriptional regulator [Nonomuraea phyllanthi]QFY07522.1 AAA family ATPase [Nonomuraea phyllanthi]